MMTREEWTDSIVQAVREGRDVNAWPITKQEFAELIVRGITERLPHKTDDEDITLKVASR